MNKLRRGRRSMQISGLWLAAAVIVLGAWPSPARADPIAGAAYSGILASGVTVDFTVSADGSQLVRYRVANVQGDTCQFLAQGEPPSWNTPLVAGAFEYRLYDAILFQGSFPTPNTASGTFRLFNRAVDDRPACDSGTVPWTAVTTASAPPTPTPTPTKPEPGPPSGLPASSPLTPKATWRTGVRARRLNLRRLTGRVTSPVPGCRRGRTVLLQRGGRTLATTRSRADGGFGFARSAATRGRLVIRVRATNGSPTRCGAALSRPILG